MNRIYYLLCLIPAFVLVAVLLPTTLDFLAPPAWAWCGTVTTNYTTYAPSPPTSELSADPARGKDLFTENCARCHNMKLHKNSTGPALHGVATRIPPGDWIYRYIRDAIALVREGDPYAMKIWEQNGNSSKDPMPHLTDTDIDAIMAWIAAYSTEPMPLAAE
jgi:mono/diheme cytochrome c family protein